MIYKMFKFQGQHFIVSYVNCVGLNNLVELKNVFEKAIISSNAMILSSTDYTFSNNGYTAIYLLSESHASIHTYPEHKSCFVDLFTCGDHCNYENFHNIMKEYLQPETSYNKLILREEKNKIIHN